MKKQEKDPGIFEQKQILNRFGQIARGERPGRLEEKDAQDGLRALHGLMKHAKEQGIFGGGLEQVFNIGIAMARGLAEEQAHSKNLLEANKRLLEK